MADGKESHTILLIPELVERSKKLNNIKCERKHTSPFILKVYNSKKKQISKLKEQMQMFEESCAALEQSAKSTEMKINSMAANIASDVQRNDKLNVKWQEMTHEYGELLERFENDMRKIDDQFYDAITKYSDENLELSMIDVKEQILKEEALLQAIVNGQPNEVEDDGIEKITTALLKSTKDIENQNFKIVSANEGLKLRIVELESVKGKLQEFFTAAQKV